MPKFIKRAPIKKPGIDSYWPLIVKRLFQSLNEIPWIGLTAVSTLTGVLVLFFYFRSINHFPSDFSSIVGLSIAACLCAGGLIAITSIALFAPAALYSHYSGDESSIGVQISFTTFERVALPLAALGLLFGYAEYPKYRDCGVFSLFAWIALILTILGIIGFFTLVFRGGWSGLFARIWAALGLTILGVVPLLVFYPLNELFTISWMSFEVIFFTLWILTVLGNVITGTVVNRVGIVFIAVFLVLVMFVAFPMAIGKPGFFPTMVAGELGIRSDGPVKLQVSRQACELVAALHTKAGQPNAVPCPDQNWNEITAQVLSNVGDRWMLEVSKVGLDQPATLRFTLPRSDVQTVAWSIEKTEKEKPTVCPVD